MNPLVSVIIPTYNGAEFIEHSLNSVYSQTYRPIELVIVDDGSTDRTPDLLQKWVAIHNSENFEVTVVGNDRGGASSSRNRGVSVAKGEFLQFLDHDDLLHPEKLALQVNAACADGADLVVGRTFPFKSREEIDESISHSAVLLGDLPVPDPFYSHMRWSHLGWLVRRELMEKVGPWNENLRLSDYEMDVRLKLSAQRISYVSAILSFWRTSNPKSESKAHGSDIYRWQRDVVNAVFHHLRIASVDDPREFVHLAKCTFVMARRFARIWRPIDSLRCLGLTSKFCATAIGCRVMECLLSAGLTLHRREIGR